MGSSSKFVCVALCTLSFLTVTFASHDDFEFEFDDTIDISAGDDNILYKKITNRVKRETLTGADGSRVTINCKTSRNEEGVCKPFKECYPLFRLRDGEESLQATALQAQQLQIERRSSNFELESIYRNVSGPCDKSIVEAISQISIYKGIPQQEYVCCPNERKPTMSKPSLPPANVPAMAETNSNKRCGKSFVDYNSAEFQNLMEEYRESSENGTEREARIVNGRTAARGEFPWNVALMNSGRQFCGGSLISNNHILTAAHCVYYMKREDVSRLRIYIGDHNVYSTSDGPNEVRMASNIYYHRAFSMKTLHNDVCVIRLSKPVQYSRYIQPVCLHNGQSRYDTGNTVADATGWGQTALKGPPSSILRVVSVKVLPQNQCINSYNGKAPGGITPGMVCAGGNGKDSCKGDSGGPLTINSHSQATQIGIVSWGIGCATYPGVYTRTDKYLSWIQKNER